MKKTLIFTVLLLLTITGAGLAKGPGPGFDGDHTPIPPGKWWMMPEVSQKLSLTPEEQKQLNDAFYQHREKMIGLRSTLSKEHLELEKQLDSDAFDAAACKTQFASLTQARASMAAERFDFLVQVRQMLGLERFQQLKWHFKQFKLKRGMQKSKKMM
jgi:Spy/CpxP family protein refolding chaperone